MPSQPDPNPPPWTLGRNHSFRRWAGMMARRGRTDHQIDEALAGGTTFPATNQVNPGNKARRYVHPTTGRSLVLDEITREVIHVGGDGFLY